MRGLVHTLSAVEHLLPMIALGLMAAQQRQLKPEFVMACFLGALVAGALIAMVIGPVAIGQATIMNVGSMVIIGCIIAAIPPLPGAVSYLLSALFGASHGYGNSATMIGTTNFHEFIPGLLAASSMALTLGIVGAEFVHRLTQQWPRIALRVAGSWIAAIGLLILGFVFRSQIN